MYAPVQSDIEDLTAPEQNNVSFHDIICLDASCECLQLQIIL